MPRPRNEWTLFIVTASGGREEVPSGFVRKGLREKLQFDLSSGETE